MIKRFALILATFGVIVLVTSPLAHATDLIDCTNVPNQDQCNLVNQHQLDTASDKNVIWKVVQFLFMLLGGIAVIMIVVGGIQYATSQGEAATLQKAKNTILYAVIGLVVAMLATGIVTFIIDKVAT